MMLTNIRLSTSQTDASPVEIIKQKTPTLILKFFLFQIKANIPSGIWKLGKLNHIAVAVPNLGKLFNFLEIV